LNDQARIKLFDTFLEGVGHAVVPFLEGRTIEFANDVGNGPMVYSTGLIQSLVPVLISITGDDTQRGPLFGM